MVEMEKKKKGFTSPIPIGHRRKQYIVVLVRPTFLNLLPQLKNKELKVHLLDSIPSSS